MRFRARPLRHVGEAEPHEAAHHGGWQMPEISLSTGGGIPHSRLGAWGGVHWTSAPGPAGPAASTFGRRPRRGTSGGDSCSIRSSPPSPGAAAAATAAAGGVPGRLGGSGTRFAAMRGTAASSSADRVAALDAREADADPVVDLDRRGGGGGCVA